MRIVFYLNLTVSILLMLAGFFAPPLGVIDDSVLSAVGLLLMFYVVAQLPDVIRASRSVRITKGDFVAEIDKED